MTNGVNELLAALQQAVKADAALVAALGPEGLTDRGHRATHFPVLVPAGIETRDFSTGDSRGAEVLLVLEIWSDVSRRAVEALAEDVRRVAINLPQALGLAQAPGPHRLVNLVHRGTVSRREAKTGLFVAEVRLRAVVE